jgi:uncharacterized heparinase superfamily protein
VSESRRTRRTGTPRELTASLVRYWNTLRYLRPGQITGRLRFRFLRPQLSVGPTPLARESFAFVAAPAQRRRSLWGPARFRFLNVERDCASARAWNDADVEKLWLYNLHYFEDLVAAGAPDRVGWHTALVERWIRENPPGTGVGWDPYPTSLRIGNWIKWRSAGNRAPAEFDRSLALQARWLRRRVEHHLLGNHLLANAKALVLAGMFFNGEEAAEWLSRGLQLLGRDFGGQVLEDGGHVERSPMYHALILEDVLDLINAADGTPDLVPLPTVRAWRECASRMIGWLDSLTHPDGDIALLNDAAFGIAATPAALRSYGERLGVPSAGRALAEVSGYLRAERGPAVLIVDVAEVGPDEQPGHAHADTLTFELSLHGERVIVDTGTSTYRQGQQRAFERSTAAHNTVEIDGCDSSEVWSSFRVARRARPQAVSVEERDATVEIRGSHDGYVRLAGRPVHTRVWQLGETSLAITDRISAGGQRAVGRLLLHPSVRPEDDRTLRLPSGRRCRWRVSGASAVIAAASWHPEFGVTHDTHCLHYAFDGPEATVVLNWIAD